MQGEREMAAGNITLGRFQLSESHRRLAEYRRSSYFEIDANGIVNVSAKDLGYRKGNRESPTHPHPSCPMRDQTEDQGSGTVCGRRQKEKGRSGDQKQSGNACL
jgi:molecular chaperone DnaK (HSP70)